MAFFTTRITFSRESGFSRNSNAPSFVARHSGLNSSVPGNHHNHRDRSQSPEVCVQDFEPIHPIAQPNIEQHDIRRLTQQMLEAFLARRNCVDLIAIFPQRSCERFANSGFIINDQNCGSH